MLKEKRTFLIVTLSFKSIFIKNDFIAGKFMLHYHYLNWPWLVVYNITTNLPSNLNIPFAFSMLEWAVNSSSSIELIHVDSFNDSNPWHPTKCEFPVSCISLSVFWISLSTVGSSITISESSLLFCSSNAKHLFC